MGFVTPPSAGFYVIIVLYMRNFFVFLLLPAIYYVLFGSFYALAQTDDERIAELYRQIEVLEKEAEKYRSNVVGEQAKAKSLQSEINILNNQISKIQTQIYITSKNIDKTKIEIGGLENNIADTQEKISYKKAAIGRLILDFYKQDSENLLLVLLKNPNISNFFTKTQAAASLSANLLDLINELKDEKQNLEANKSESESKKRELEILNQKNQQQNNSLAQTKNGKNGLLTQTKGQEAQYQKILDEIELKKSLFF